MNNNVFVVTEEFDNCETYEDHYSFTTIMAVTSTKEEAEKIVDNLYNEILSMKTDRFGKGLFAELREKDDGTIYDVFVSCVGNYSQESGSYSYCIEEFELGKVKKIEL